MSVILDIDDHLTNRETVEDVLNDLGCDLLAEVRREMVTRNTMICVQIYPDNPVGFARFYHHDIEACLLLAVECVKNIRGAS